MADEIYVHNNAGVLVQLRLTQDTENPFESILEISPSKFKMSPPKTHKVILQTSLKSRNKAVYLPLPHRSNITFKLLKPLKARLYQDSDDDHIIELYLTN